MSTAPDSEDKRDLALRLRPFAERDTRTLLDGAEPAFLSAFVTRQRERISQLALPVAGLVVVIEGRKEVLWGAERRDYGPGEALLLPAGSQVDVVNDPDAASGVYRALFLRLSRELVIEAARLWPDLARRSSGPSHGTAVDLTPSLCSAILHVAEALASGFGFSGRMIEHRTLEILLVLAEQGALVLTPKYVERSVAEAVRLLVRHKLDWTWTAEAVAVRLSLSEATLRRRLRGEQQSLSALLLEERMNAARILLCERDADVAETLAATGYASRSHFTRHFRKAFGMSPSMARQQRHRTAA